MVEPKTREDLDKGISTLENRISGILKYIENNPASDPNAYEMNEVMFEIADIGFFGRKFETEAYAFLQDKRYKELMSKFSGMMQYRLPQLISETQGLHATHLHNYFQESLRNMATLNRLGYDAVENTKELFNSVCGVNLFIHQRNRDLEQQNNMVESIYTNAIENTKIILAYEEYKENAENQIRPYKTRDAIVDDMYNEIQSSYNKSLNETLITTKDGNKKM